jgi:hypothetical protein
MRVGAVIADKNNVEMRIVRQYLNDVEDHTIAERVKRPVEFVRMVIGEYNKRGRPPLLHEELGIRKITKKVPNIGSVGSHFNETTAKVSLPKLSFLDD